MKNVGMIAGENQRPLAKSIGMNFLPDSGSFNATLPCLFQEQTANQK